MIEEPSETEEKNEDITDGTPFEECSTVDTKKSASSLSFKEIYEAKMRGEDAFAPFVKSSETVDFAEMDPWGRSKYDMFKKNTETIADEVSDVNSNIQGESGQGGEPLDDVNTKNPSGTSGQGGEPLDDVDAESPSGTSGQGGDLLEDMDKKDGDKNKQGETDDLLDKVDTKQPTGTSGQGGDQLDEVKKSEIPNGKTIPTLREMMAIRKSGTRPDAISSANGELERPDLGTFKKSTLPESVRMGVGVDPKKVVERDIAEYNLYKARQTF